MRYLGCLLLSFLVPVSSTSALSAESPKSWVDQREQYEAWLQEAEVVGIEEVGEGVTNPWKVALRQGDVVFHAIYKPIRRGRHKGFWESYQAEVAAYELDKLLGLDMVPPTVIRRIDKDLGSLQLWVEGCESYKRAEARVPQTPGFSHQVSRMKMFDNLIFNEDRNGGNFLLDSGFNVVLIDHSRAFLDRGDLLKKKSWLPAQYDRRLVERLRSLRLEELEPRLKDLLMGGQIESILKRRDKLLEHLQALIDQHGEKRVLFE